MNLQQESYSAEELARLFGISSNAVELLDKRGYLVAASVEGEKRYLRSGVETFLDRILAEMLGARGRELT